LVGAHACVSCAESANGWNVAREMASNLYGRAVPASQ